MEQIAYRTVGTHRRIKAASSVRYQREDDARRVAVVDELAAEAHALGVSVGDRRRPIPTTTNATATIAAAMPAM